MSTPERGRRATDLFDERLARLDRLIEIQAPRSVIAEECSLVLQAHEGGPLAGHWGLVRRSIKSMIRFVWIWYVETFTLKALCRLNIYHQIDDTDGCGCPFCGKGGDPAMLAEIKEACDVDF